MLDGGAVRLPYLNKLHVLFLLFALANISFLGVLLFMLQKVSSLN